MRRESVSRWMRNGEMRPGRMDALYHSLTTETSLSDPFRGHSRFPVIARCAKIFLTNGRLRISMGGCSLSHPEFVGDRQPHSCKFVRHAPSDLITRSVIVLPIASNSLNTIRVGGTRVFSGNQETLSDFPNQALPRSRPPTSTVCY